MVSVQELTLNDKLRLDRKRVEIAIVSKGKNNFVQNIPPIILMGMSFVVFFCVVPTMEITAKIHPNPAPLVGLSIFFFWSAMGTLVFFSQILAALKNGIKEGKLLFVNNDALGSYFVAYTSSFPKVLNLDKVSMIRGNRILVKEYGKDEFGSYALFDWHGIAKMKIYVPKSEVERALAELDKK